MHCDNKHTPSGNNSVCVCVCVCVSKQFKPLETECRAKKGVCDLAEYCDGSSPLCPPDVYRPNAVTCTVDEVHSYTIVCIHHARTADNMEQYKLLSAEYEISVYYYYKCNISP